MVMLYNETTRLSTMDFDVMRFLPAFGLRLAFAPEHSFGARTSVRFFSHVSTFLLDDLLDRVFDGFGRLRLNFDFQFDFRAVFGRLRLLDSHLCSFHQSYLQIRSCVCVVFHPKCLCFGVLRRGFRIKYVAVTKIKIALDNWEVLRFSPTLVEIQK
jgi:hypothetical protein